MIASATWMKDQQFEAKSESGHSITFDVAGQAGPTPMEAVLMGLCGCTAIDVANILTKKREPFTGLHVSADAEKAKDSPSVFTHIKLTYRISGNVCPKAVQDAVLLSKNKYCSVSAMLQKTAHIDFVVEQTGAEMVTRD